MNKENTSKLWKIIQEAGDYLVGQRDTMVDLGSVFTETFKMKREVLFT